MAQDVLVIELICDHRGSTGLALLLVLRALLALCVSLHGITRLYGDPLPLSGLSIPRTTGVWRPLQSLGVYRPKGRI